MRIPVADQCTAPRSVSIVSVERICLPCNRQGNPRIKIDEMRMTAGQAAVRYHTMRIVARRARRLIIYNMRLMLLKTLVGEDTVSVMASIT
jgi:hypothetical protein